MKLKDSERNEEGYFPLGNTSFILLVVRAHLLLPGLPLPTHPTNQPTKK